MKTRYTTAGLIHQSHRMKYLLAFEGVLVGAIAGGIAIIYRLALSFSEATISQVLAYAATHHVAAVLWFGALLVMALVVGWLIHLEPMISGSGIPQVEGELAGFFDTRWLRVLLAKIVGGVLCIFGGLSLGREGPSVQLGAMGGKGFSRLLGRSNVEERYLMTCGASAGLAAAFNAPLAGVMFALEEVHKNFSMTMLLSAMTASVTADFVSKVVFGMAPVFQFSVAGMLPLRYYGWVVLLGVLLGAAGAFYNWALARAQDLYAHLHFLKKELRPVIPFLLAGVLGFTLPQVLGGGHTMIGLLSGGGLTMGMMALLLVVKFLFSMISFGSGAPGGIFFPLLVLGAYIGGIYATFLVEGMGMDSALISNFVILAMAGFFTAIVRAPITGVVLIMEMTGSLTHMLSLAVVAVTAEIVAVALGAVPVYDMLLGRMLPNGAVQMPETDAKTLVSVPVALGAYVEGRAVWEVDWPQNSLLVAIRRGEGEIIPRGDTRIQKNDMLVALTDVALQKDTCRQLKLLCAAPEDKSMPADGAGGEKTLRYRHN